MPAKNSIKIIKIPNSKLKPTVDSDGFSRMPKLYLELLENKTKIKQDLINKEHPIKDVPVDEIKNSRNNKEINIEKLDDISKCELPKKEVKENRKYSKEGSKSSENSDTEKEEDKEENEKEEEEDEKEEDKEDNVSNRLRELLEEDSEDKSLSKDREEKSSQSHERKEQYKKSRDNRESRENRESIYENERNKEPPSLADLEASGKYVNKKVYRNAEQREKNSQDEYDLKRELLFKMEILKKTYKNAVLPDVSIHTDYSTLKEVYDSALRSLSLDSTVKQYKTFLIGGFGLVEFLLGNFLNFDMNGFTSQQALNMDSYEQLLTELGEKSYVHGESKWPVEARLVFAIVINTAFFLLSKMIMKKSGNNIMNMMNTMNKPAENFPKRRMKGPSINPDDLPDTEEKNNEN